MSVAPVTKLSAAVLACTLLLGSGLSAQEPYSTYGGYNNYGNAAYGRAPTTYRKGRLPAGQAGQTTAVPAMPAGSFALDANPVPPFGSHESRAQGGNASMFSPNTGVANPATAARQAAYAQPSVQGQPTANNQAGGLEQAPPYFDATSYAAYAASLTAGNPASAATAPAAPSASSAVSRATAGAGSSAANYGSSVATPAYGATPYAGTPAADAPYAPAPYSVDNSMRVTSQTAPAESTADLVRGTGTIPPVGGFMAPPDPSHSAEAVSATIVGAPITGAPVPGATLATTTLAPTYAAPSYSAPAATLPAAPDAAAAAVTVTPPPSSVTAALEAALPQLQMQLQNPYGTGETPAATYDPNLNAYVLPPIYAKVNLWQTPSGELLTSPPPGTVPAPLAPALTAQVPAVTPNYYAQAQAQAQAAAAAQAQLAAAQTQAQQQAQLLAQQQQAAYQLQLQQAQYQQAQLAAQQAQLQADRLKEAQWQAEQLKIQQVQAEQQLQLLQADADAKARAAAQAVANAQAAAAVAAQARQYSGQAAATPGYVGVPSTGVMHPGHIPGYGTAVGNEPVVSQMLPGAADPGYCSACPAPVTATITPPGARGSAPDIAPETIAASPVPVAITPGDAWRYMNSGIQIAVLDVRDELERDVDGHIPGDIFVPLNPFATFPQRVYRAIPNYNIPVIVYCRSGVPSANAADTMAKMGYSRVLVLGSLGTWPYAKTK